ncbi:DUF3842 family protein [Chloroflexales bacterium ZM16-3]|nr:DUF3842 family protein [Chloroflexales bacterium ZM16-3]
MSNIRRWYILLVALISLQAVAWAVIALLRNVLGVWGSLAREAVAFQIAVIIIGLPVFLIHWIWAQRLAAGDLEERGAALRRLYLYGTMAVLLAPALSSAYNLAQGLLGLLLDPSGRWNLTGRSAAQGLLGDLMPVLVLGLLWLYHRQVARADAVAVPLVDNSALVRRLYLLVFSGTGLLITGQAAIALLRWVLYQMGGAGVIGGRAALIDPVAGLLVGMPLWVLSWHLAQALFHSPDIGERESALRKFYLHAVVFLSALIAVSGTTLMLAGLLRQALGLTPQGDVRDPLSTVLIAAVIWVYHSLALRADAALIREVPRQAGVRRLSWYLVASIGLAAVLIGLGGVLSALIRALGSSTFGNDLREQLAWSLAALISGLPVWVLIWRRAQGAAEADGPAGDDERGSLVRRIYLYGFLFAATLTILSGLVYIVFRLLRVALGTSPEGGLLADLAQAIAFSGIAAGVLAYHGGILRGEGRRRQAAEATRAAELRVAVLDLDEGTFGRALVERLRHELPGLAISPIGLTPAAAAAMGAAADPRGLAAQLAESSLIIGPWQIAVPQAAGAEVAQSVGDSPARKLLLPAPAEGWDWAGVELWSGEDAINQIVVAVRQVLGGDPIRLVRPVAPLTIVGGVLLLILLLILILFLAASFINLG